MELRQNKNIFVYLYILYFEASEVPNFGGNLSVNFKRTFVRTLCNIPKGKYQFVSKWRNRTLAQEHNLLSNLKVLVIDSVNLMRA